MRIDPVSSSHEGQYHLVNDQGISEEASLVLVVDGTVGPWTEFGACSKSCTQANSTSGKRNREWKRGVTIFSREPGADEAVCSAQEWRTSMF